MARSGFEKARRTLTAIAAILFVCVALLNRPPSDRETLNETLEYLGFGLLIVATLGRIWSAAYLSGRKSQELCVTGPYSISRNPLYFFSMLGAVGVTALAESVVLILVVFCLFQLFYAFVIRHEERRLRAIFGQEFENYCRRVPRLVPWPWLYRDEETIVMYTRPFRRVVIDTSVFLWIFLLVEFYEVIETHLGRRLLPDLWQLW